MPDPLDLTSIRERAEIAAIAQENHEFLGVGVRDSDGLLEVGDYDPAALVRFDSAADVPALIAEIERLRAIAAPLERLEAWANREGAVRKYAAAMQWDGSVMCGLYEDARHERRSVELRGANASEAITAVLDAWDAKYGKDAPHA